MSERAVEPKVRPSVLDRLIDLEPRASADPLPTWRDSVRQLRVAVARDLEWLLNTRRIARPAPAHLGEVCSSVYHFGLPDITSMSRDSAETNRLLARRMEECLRLFEPRLTGIQVTAVEREGEGSHRLRFLIEAVLRMEPEPERIRFDTVLEVGSGEFLVSGDDDA